MWGFPDSSVGKASACNAGDLGSIPVLGRSPGEGNENPLQDSDLENPMDRGTWWATVCGTPWTAAPQARPSMGFSRQEYWRGLPFPSPGDLLNSGIEPMYPALAGRFFTTDPPGKPYFTFTLTLLAITILLFVSESLSILGTLYKWNHTVFVLL